MNKWSKSPLAKCFWLLLCACVCCAGYWAATISDPDPVIPDGNLGLFVPPESLDLGEVWEQRSYRCSLPITNRTGKEIQIKDFVSSCTCLSVNPRLLVIGSGKSGAVELTLDLSKGSGKRDDRSIREASVGLAPIISGEPWLVGWQIRVRIRSAVSLSHAVLDFGDSLAFGLPVTPKEVEITPHVPLKELQVTCEPSNGLVRQVSSSELPYRFEVVPKGRPEPGAFHFDLKFQPVPERGIIIPATYLPVRGSFGERIRAFPGAVVLGPRLIGEEAQDNVIIRSVSDKPIRVERLETDDPDCVVTRIETKINAFRIIQRITRKGESVANITFHVKEMTEQKVVPVRVSYFGQSSP